MDSALIEKIEAESSPSEIKMAQKLNNIAELRNTGQIGILQNNSMRCHRCHNKR